MGMPHYGDNLDILRHDLKHESTDLVHHDPPFDSAPNDNAFFHEKHGRDGASWLTFVSGLGGTGHRPVPSGDSPDRMAADATSRAPAISSDAAADRSASRGPEVSLVPIIGEPTTPNEAASAGCYEYPTPPHRANP